MEATVAVHVYWRLRSSLSQTSPRYQLHSCHRWLHRACRIATHCSSSLPLQSDDDAVITANHCRATKWPIDSDGERWIHLRPLQARWCLCCVVPLMTYCCCSHRRISIDCGCHAMLVASIAKAACCPIRSGKITADAADSKKQPIMQLPTAVAAIAVAGLVERIWSTFPPAPYAASPQWFTYAYTGRHDKRVREMKERAWLRFIQQTNWRAIRINKVNALKMADG